MRIRRNPLRMVGLSLYTTVPVQLKAPPIEATVLPPPSLILAPPASTHVDIHTAQLVQPAVAPTEEVCLQSCAWTLHPHTLNPENLDDGLIGDAWREPRENPRLASENVNIVFLLKRKKVDQHIIKEQEQQEKVNEKLKQDGSGQQKKGCSNKKMMAKVIKKEEEEEKVNKQPKQDGSSHQKKSCFNKKMSTMVIKEEEEEVNKKLKRDGSGQQKKSCSKKKMTTEVIKEEVATAHKPSRCKRSDGRNWRCSERPALPHTLCENHLHKSRLSYNKRKEARSKSASHKASAINFEADLWKASSSSRRAWTSAPPSSSFISTGAVALATDASESSKAAPSLPVPTSVPPNSKQQRKNKKKGDDYSAGVFHYPEPFGPFRGKQRTNYDNNDRVEASLIANDVEALEEEALEGMMNLCSKVVTKRGSA